MKIMVVGLYPTEASPVFSLEIARGLMKNNIDVYAILPCNINNLKDWYDCLDKNKIILDLTNIETKYGKAKSLMKILLNKNRLFSHIENISFDYTIYTFYHGWNNVFIKLINSQKNVLFLHDPILHSGEDEKKKNKVFAQTKKMEKLVVLSQKFVSITEKNYQRKLGDVLYMPLGLLGKGNFEYNKLSKYNEDTPINYLFFGRISEYKGLKVLLNAYKKLNVNCSLTIAGAGDFSEYEQMTKGLPNIKLINRYISEDEIPDLFNKDNCVLVLPYLDATQSGVISLAYMYGVPVIASRSGALEEQLDNGRIGLFFDPGNVSELTECMNLISIDYQLRLREAQKMFDYSLKFDWSKSLASLIDEMENKNE